MGAKKKPLRAVALMVPAMAVTTATSEIAALQTQQHPFVQHPPQLQLQLPKLCFWF